MPECEKPAPKENVRRSWAVTWKHESRVTRTAICSKVDAENLYHALSMSQDCIVYPPTRKK